MICQGNCECFNIGFVFVIARSVATKQSQYEIATAFLTESLAMTEGLRLPRLPFGRLDSMGIGF